MASTTRSYKQILDQIESLKREADEIRKKEVDAVIGRMKEAIASYGISAADLGFRIGKPGRAPGAAKASSAVSANGSKANRPVKYRDTSGNTWIGMGKRPDWLRKALSAGKTLADFAV